MTRWLNCLLGSLAWCCLLPGAAWADPWPNPPPDHWYRQLVDIDFVRPYAVLPPRRDGVVIDARDTARRFEAGHLPGAISLPAKRFAELATDRLPADKNQLIIFYCDGFECILSHLAADEAEDLGYRNIRVYPGGFPEWFRQGEVMALGAAHLKQRVAAGDIGRLLDLRDPVAYARAHLPGAVNLPAAQLESSTHAVLPADKSTPLLIYGDADDAGRCYALARQIHQLGYRRVMLLEGGFPAWQALGAAVAVP